MKKNYLKKAFILTLHFLIFLKPLFCQKSIEFKNQNITDILLVLARENGISIITDNTVSGKVSFYFEDITNKNALFSFLDANELLWKEENGIIKVSEKNHDETNETLKLQEAPAEKKKILLKINEGLYSVETDSCSLFEILKELFNAEGKEFSLFFTSDKKVENINLKDKDFTSILNFLLEKTEGDFIIKDSVYCIFENQKKNASSLLKENFFYTLKEKSTAELCNVIPPEITSSLSFKTDKEKNSIFARGTPREIELLKKFIESFEKTNCDFESRIFHFKFISPEKFISMIPENLILKTPFVLENNVDAIFFGNENIFEKIQSLQNMADVKKEIFPVTLKFIKTSELLKNLPPDISSEKIKESICPNLIFFIGSEEEKNVFLKTLELIDKPKPQIKYQLLIIQFNEGKNKTRKNSVTVSKKNGDFAWGFSSELSNLMNIDFDIISRLGVEYAVNLNHQLSENNARVFTDTTLTGIAEQDVRFQNTETYRYLEYEYDTNGNTTTASGVTQQITSGLILNLNGWISGDNMITINIDATISKQNGESTSSIPSTSERVISSQVRTYSGESIVLSGLIKEDENSSRSVHPVLSSIPIIGRLFEQESSSFDKNEFEIYIVPYLLTESAEEKYSLKKIYSEILGDSNCL